MLKVLVACGCGMGSSQLLKMNCANVLKKLGIENTVHHTSFKLKEGSKTKIIGLKNLMNKKELEEKLREGGFAN